MVAGRHLSRVRRPENEVAAWIDSTSNGRKVGILVAPPPLSSLESSPNSASESWPRSPKDTKYLVGGSGGDGLLLALLLIAIANLRHLFSARRPAWSCPKG